MALSIHAISSAVHNNIHNGLNQPSSITIALEQIEDEVDLTRAEIIDALVKKRQFSAQGFYSTLPKLQLSKADIGDTLMPVGYELLECKIPRLLFINGLRTIDYIGGADGFSPYKFVETGIYMHAHLDLKTGTKPTCWIEDDTLRVLSPMRQKTKATATLLRVRAIVAKPLEMLGYSGCEFTRDSDYPVSETVSRAIIDSLSSRYIQYYYRLQGPPTNTQAQISGSAPAK